jgi:hypothetical protein
MKTSIYLVAALSLAGVVSGMASNSRAGLPSETHRIGGKGFEIQMPKGMKLVSSSQSAERNYPPSVEWGRRPWSPGVLMETRNANVIVISYFNDDEFNRLKKADGSMYSSPYYSDTILKHHTKVEVYKTQSGRAPAIIRYDIKVDGGGFCLVANVDRYENPHYDSDIQEMIASLKTFALAKAKP